MPEYGTLKSEYAKFHKATAGIVLKTDTGQTVTDEIAFGGTSDFSITSHNVVSAITAMKRKAT